jgi:hypothetical protein
MVDSLMKRKILFATACFMASLGLWLTIVDSQARGIENISIEIQVKDEEGKAVPYAAVWRTQDPCGIEAQNRIKTGENCFNGDDLKRTATRLIESFEYAVSYAAPRPFEQIRLPVAVDGEGRFFEHGEGSTWYWGLKQPLVKELNFWFAFLKQGYEPAIAHVKLTPVSSVYRGTVVMKSDARFARQVSVHRESFERLRYELSDQRRNQVLTFENADRLWSLRNNLLKLVSAAENAGERELAARMYWRLLFMPSINTIVTKDGLKIVGFNSGSGGADYKLYWTKSEQLDSANPFHSHSTALNTLPEGLIRKREPLADEDRKILEDFAQRRAAEIQSNMSRMWPGHVLYQTGVLTQLGHYERAYQWCKDLEKIEPKSDILKLSYSSLSGTMGLRRVPIPAHWKLPQSSVF